MKPRLERIWVNQYKSCLMRKMWKEKVLILRKQRDEKDLRENDTSWHTEDRQKVTNVIRAGKKENKAKDQNKYYTKNTKKPILRKLT